MVVTPPIGLMVPQLPAYATSFDSGGKTYLYERLTTQVCSACAACGGPQGREDLVVREWICGGCGAWHDRDINSAINILVSGRNGGLRKTEIPSLSGRGRR
jgi:transposase